MIFSNKTKATWKAAFRLIRNDTRVSQVAEYNRLIKKYNKAIETFKSEEYHKFKAYHLARENGFQGSSVYYWDQAAKLIKLSNEAIEYVKVMVEEDLARLRWRIRYFHQ